MTGLQNKHKYRFRTRAVNKIGTSDACEMLGDDILIKDPWGEDRTVFSFLERYENLILSTDEPTKPGTPNVVDWGPNHCDLSWQAPESDGGAPITHYEIEFMVTFHLILSLSAEVSLVDSSQQEKNMGLWQSGKTIPASALRESNGLLHGTIDGLVEGCEYQFRIKVLIRRNTFFYVPSIFLFFSGHQQRWTFCPV